MAPKSAAPAAVPLAVPPSAAALERCLLDLLARRAPTATVCPSEVARALAEDWRPLMPAVRAVAQALADRGLVVATQGGVVVSATAAHGPIRLRRAAGPGARGDGVS